MKIEATKSMTDIIINAASVSYIISDDKFSEKNDFISNLKIGFDPLGLSVHVNSGNYVLIFYALNRVFSLMTISSRWTAKL